MRKFKWINFNEIFDLLNELGIERGSSLIFFSLKGIKKNFKNNEYMKPVS